MCLEMGSEMDSFLQYYLVVQVAEVEVVVALEADVSTEVVLQGRQ